MANGEVEKVRAVVANAAEFDAAGKATRLEADLARREGALAQEKLAHASSEAEFLQTDAATRR